MDSFISSKLFFPVVALYVATFQWSSESNPRIILFLALVVRYITGRFVHEYDPTLGKLTEHGHGTTKNY
jgi:hypothetical protein